MKHPKLLYRPEIDGLRTIAVTSVLIYHAKFYFWDREWLKGGYIGVDIFFVISGYLIARIILSELHEKGTFSFSNFYDRRIRRILPVLLVVIFFSIPFAWQKLLPAPFVEYLQSIFSALFFSSNFFFYFTTTEYGADSALIKPFLHTWSLGVEEQFYLVFPIIAILAFKYFRNGFVILVVFLSLCSLSLAELLQQRNSDLNFFLPISRFWELAVGSLIAYSELNQMKVNRSSNFTRVLSVIGLALVVLSLSFFDAKTPHPSLYTIVPILGVSLIVIFASSDDGLVGTLLSSRVFVGIGLISYSLYLWHFPIFAFSRLSMEDPSNLDKLGWITLTFLISILSYFLVERVFRNRKLVNSKNFYSTLGAGFLFLVVFAFFAFSTNGFEKRTEALFSAAAKEFNDSLQITPPSKKFVEVPDGSRVALLIGDSFAENYGRLGNYISDEFIFINLSYLGCRFDFDGNLDPYQKEGPTRAKYKDTCDTTEKYLNNKSFMEMIDVILYVTASNLDQIESNKMKSKLMSLFEKKSPSADLFVFGPYFQLDSQKVGRCDNLRWRRNKASAQVCIESSKKFNPDVERTILSKGKKLPEGTYYISLFRTMKNDDGSFPYENNGVPFMNDDTHLNVAFIDLFARKLINYDRGDANIKFLRNQYFKVLN